MAPRKTRKSLDSAPEPPKAASRRAPEGRDLPVPPSAPRIYRNTFVEGEPNVGSIDLGNVILAQLDDVYLARKPDDERNKLGRMDGYVREVDTAFGPARVRLETCGAKDASGVAMTEYVVAHFLFSLDEDLEYEALHHHLALVQTRRSWPVKEDKNLYELDLRTLKAKRSLAGYVLRADALDDFMINAGWSTLLAGVAPEERTDRMVRYYLEHKVRDLETERDGLKEDLDEKEKRVKELEEELDAKTTIAGAVQGFSFNDPCKICGRVGYHDPISCPIPTHSRAFA